MLLFNVIFECSLDCCTFWVFATEYYGVSHNISPTPNVEIHAFIITQHKEKKRCLILELFCTFTTKVIWMNTLYPSIYPFIHLLIHQTSRFPYYSLPGADLGHRVTKASGVRFRVAWSLVKVEIFVWCLTLIWRNSYSFLFLICLLFLSLFSF